MESIEAKVEDFGLKCTCGHALVFTDKGLSCPNCERTRSLIVQRGYKVYKVLAAKNILVSATFITEAQLSILLDSGVSVTIH
jgi:hypothetical protein